MPTGNREPSTLRAPSRPNHNNNGLQHQRVTHIQRARMLTAMAQACTEHGAANLTVAHVVQRAGVSRRTFYEIFDDIGDCMLAAVDEAISRVAERVLPAYRAPGRWRERTRGVLTALLGLFDEEPSLARLLVVETLAAGQAALQRRNRVLACVIDAVDDEGRRESRASTTATRLTAEGVVGGVLSVLHSRLLEKPSTGRLAELQNPLMSMIVLPYLGSAAARRELERPPTAPMRQPVHGDSNPLKQLGMRLTYRTVRVLIAVQAIPGGSNRAVGQRAGIDDQGQISKLLARLEKLGLVTNAGLRPGKGTPNEWRLTERGEEVCGALSGGV